MEIVIEAGVKEYLKKASTNRLVINMIPGETSGGCGCGKTRRFYTPDIRPAKSEESFSKGFQKFQSNGIDIWVAKKALSGSNDSTVTVFTTKTFFIEKLECKGIEIVFD